MSGLVYWLDGELREWTDTPVGFLTHALHYGTGVFEGIRAYPGDRGPLVFRLKDHLDRMRRGGDVLGMDLDTDALIDVTHDLLRRNRLESAYVRPIAFYAGGGLHLDVDGLELRVAVAVMPWTSHLGGEADDVFVVEATGENVFCVFGDTVVAVEHPDALPGITRATVAELSGAVSRPVRLDELRQADEIFLTGTSAEVAPVTQLDTERTLPIGPVTRELQALYQRVVHGRVEQRWSA